MDFFEKPLLKISSGPLQECLNGEFVRVGPNPKFVPVAGYHWYDLLLRENHSSIFIALEAFSLPFNSINKAEYQCAWDLLNL
jgi:hypothetical protein